MNSKHGVTLSEVWEDGTALTFLNCDYDDLNVERPIFISLKDVNINGNVSPESIIALYPEQAKALGEYLLKMIGEKANA